MQKTGTKIYLITHNHNIKETISHPFSEKRGVENRLTAPINRITMAKGQLGIDPRCFEITREYLITHPKAMLEDKH